MMFSPKIRRSIHIIFFCCLAFIVLFLSIYLINIYKINQGYYQKYNTDSPVSLRKFPYPYQAAMAISSDIDNTETLKEFLEIQKFLSTREITSMGQGIELEIGNSFFFYEPPTGAISYYLGGPQVARTIINFILAGYIDVIHSYGKKTDFTRKDAIEALQELENYNCKIEVWVDHAKTIDNFGDDVTFGQGDHPDSKSYHADATLDYGIKFVWLGRVTMVIGQSVPITMKTFISIFDADHPFHSFVNISKEFAKNILAVFSNKKYAMHKENDLVKMTELDDGQKVYEFIRFDNFWKGVATEADAKSLSYAISEQTIHRLKKVSGYMIVYTHFGKNADCAQYIPKETQEALRNLAKEYRAGNIYVTTTSKLLNYYINHKYLNWSFEFNGVETNINIQNVKEPIFGTFIPTVKDLSGITFYVPDNGKTHLFIDEREIEDIQRNAADYSRRESVTIPMSLLEYPLDED